MKTLKNRTSLRNVLDLVADGHLCIMETAADANSRMLHMDKRAEQFPGGKLSISRRYCDAGLDGLQTAMMFQRALLDRAMDELQVIRENIQTI